MKAFLRQCAFLLSLAGILISFSASTSAAEIKVVTTFIPVYSWATGVAGDKAKVENLSDGSVGPHEFQLTPSSMRKLNNADLIIGIGLELEPWLEAVKKNGVLSKETKIIFLGDLLDTKLLLKSEEEHEEHGHHEEHEHHHGEYDPHIWMDPILAQECVKQLAAELGKLDEENADTYSSNAAEYNKTLAQLDKDITSALKDAQLQPFFTKHDAFSYFDKRYHLNCAGILETIPDSDVSPRHIAKLLKKIRTEKVVAIMVPTKAQDQLVARLAKDGKLKIGELETLETLDDGELNVQTYERMLRANLKELLRVLKK